MGGAPPPGQGRRGRDPNCGRPAGRRNAVGVAVGEAVLPERYARHQLTMIQAADRVGGNAFLVATALDSFGTPRASTDGPDPDPIPGGSGSDASSSWAAAAARRRGRAIGQHNDASAMRERHLDHLDRPGRTSRFVPWGSATADRFAVGDDVLAADPAHYRERAVCPSRPG